LKYKLFIAAILFLSIAGFAQQMYTYTDAKIKFTVPAGWKMIAEDHQVSAVNSDESIVVFFEILNDDDIDENTITELVAALEKEFSNVQIEVSDKVEQHLGMDFVAYGGAMEGADKTPLVIVGVFLETPSKHVLAITMVGDAESVNANNAELESLFDSITPLKMTK
jgi:hypothetical protein